MRVKPFTFILHILPWAALLLLPYAFHSPDENASGVGALPVPYLTVSNSVNIGLFYFNALFLFPMLCNAKRWFMYVPGVVMVFVGIYYVKMYLGMTLFPDIHIDNFVERMHIWSSAFILLLSIIYRLGFDAVQREQMLKERDAERLASELQVLRARISPHFFFNVLNNLVAMARAKSDQLEPSLLRLSALMRYVLHEADRKSVPIEREIEHLRGYIELQKMRFQDVRIAVDIQNGAGERMVEPLLLIPFVENAFKHGTLSVNDPFIDIKIAVESSRLRLEVANRIGSAGQDRNSGIGLHDVERRLRLAYPGKHSVSVSEDEDIYRVNLTLELQ